MENEFLLSPENNRLTIYPIKNKLILGINLSKICSLNLLDNYE
jgi:hypothetical protein